MVDLAREHGVTPKDDRSSKTASPSSIKSRLLRVLGHFQGGSAIGDGICTRKNGAAPSVTAHLV